MRPPEIISELRNAARLLILLGRMRFTDEERRQLSDQLASFTSWKHFTGLAIRHGVAPLVWQNIIELGFDQLFPSSERTILENIRLKSVARVTWINEAVAGVTARLEEGGIKVVLLKGMALEHSLYGSRGLRQMSDADLLIAPGDALMARDLLVREGFRAMPLKSPLYRHIILDLGNHLPELHRDGFSVDLHFRLFGPEGSRLTEVAIEESELISFGGREYHILSPLFTLLSLTRHITKHELKGEFQLRLWTDIFLLLDRYREQIMSDRLTALADEAGLIPELRMVMTIMEREWGVEIPEAMRALPGPEQERVVRFNNDVIYPGSLIAVSSREVFSGNLNGLDRWWKKIIYLAGDIFPSITFIKRRYRRRTTVGALACYPHRLGKLSWLFTLSRYK